MKKFSVLLVTAALALSASAGVNNQVVKNPTTKVNVKEMKAKATTHESMSFKRNGVTTASPVMLKKMDWQARPTTPMFRAENDIVWDFEGENAIEGWMALDNDGDGYGWEYVDNTNLETGRFNCHSGEGVMVSASYDNDAGALFPDNWLISPVVNLKNTLYFYASGQDASWAAEVFAVYVCVGTPTSLNDFVQVGADKTATGNWVQYVYDLSDYVGQEGCIAIRHYNVTDQFYLNVDDVTLTDEIIEPEPEPETPTIITELPAGCAEFQFLRAGYSIYSSMFGIGMSEVDGNLNVAFSEDGTKAYIQNPMWWFDSYGSWVEGDFDVTTGIITVPVGQYLSWNDSYGYGVQLMWGSTYVYLDTDENGEEGYYLGNAVDERAEEIQFQINPEFTTIDLLGCEADIEAEFPLNYDATGLYGMWSDDQTWAGSLEFTTEGQHIGQLLVVKPIQPANPTADEWYDCENEGGYSRFYFTLPKYDINGDPIDPTLVSYKIYTDEDQQFTFPAEDYTFDLTEDIDEVFYDLYTNAVDFHNNYCYFYRTNAEGYDPFFTWRIGIQAIYNVDGEAFASDIVYLEVFEHETPVEPEDPHMKGYWLVAMGADGEPVWYQMSEGANGDYTTTLSLDYDTFGYVYYDAQNPGERHNVDYYIMIDGVRYGANDAEVATVLGTALDNELFEGEGFYTLPVGYNYNMGVAIGPDGDYYVYAAQAGFTGVDELNAGKTVANVRYFNVMGQEMAQPEGMTIAVTTYTDGTTSAVKVVK